MIYSLRKIPPLFVFLTSRILVISKYRLLFFILRTTLQAIGQTTFWVTLQAIGQTTFWVTLQAIGQTTFWVTLQIISITAHAEAQTNNSPIPSHQEQTHLCSQANGVYLPERGCFCPALNKFISLNQESEKRECQNNFAVEQVNTLSTITMEREPLRQNCIEVCPKNQPPFFCPRILKSLIFQDKKSSHFGITSSPVAQCKTPEKVNPSQLEIDINQSHFIESFVPPRRVSSPSCALNTTNQTGQMSRNQREVTSQDKGRFVADYYYSMKRLEKGIEQTLTQLTSLNEISAEKGQALLDHNVACDFKEFPALIEKCKNLKQCSAPGRVIETAKQTIQALDTKKLLEKELNTIRPQTILETNRYISMSQTTGFQTENTEPSEYSKVLEAQKEKIESLKNQEEKTTATIGMIDKLYPWITGNKFESGLSDLSEKEQKSPQNIANLLKDQAKATKTTLLEKLKKQKQALQCLNNPVYMPDQCKNVFETLSDSPLLDDLDSYGLSAPALSALKMAKCRALQREKKESTDNLIEILALDTLLTAITLPLTGIAAGGRAAMKVAKLLSVGSKSKPTLGMTGGLLGAEVLASTEHIKHAHKECSQNWNQLEEAKFESHSINCSEKIKETATLKANYKSCLMSTAFATLPFAFPGATATVRAIRETSKKAKELKRFKTLGEQSLGKPLTDKQVKAIYKAHFVGKIGIEGARLESSYTWHELRQKTKILRDAGFTPEQSRKLIESGIIGNKKP